MILPEPFTAAFASALDRKGKAGFKGGVRLLFVGLLLLQSPLTGLSSCHPKWGLFADLSEGLHGVGAAAQPCPACPEHPTNPQCPCPAPKGPTCVMDPR